MTLELQMALDNIAKVARQHVEHHIIRHSGRLRTGLWYTLVLGQVFMGKQKSIGNNMRKTFNHGNEKKF